MGDWKAGLILTLGGIALMMPILWLLTRADAQTQRYYQAWLVPNLVSRNALDLLGLVYRDLYRVLGIGRIRVK